eukprot:25078-Eustigmatos_ZCMA.PRE.1
MAPLAQPCAASSFTAETHSHIARTYVLGVVIQHTGTKWKLSILTSPFVAVCLITTLSSIPEKIYPDSS